MPVRTELCRFEAADGEALHGLLLRPENGQESDLAIIQIHGVGGSFYRGIGSVVTEMLAERGWHAMPMNTRGHDWITRGRDPQAFIGSTYENFEDCLPDIDGALAFLGSRGYRRFILYGQSLGAVKVVFYQGMQQRREVVGVIATSPPRQFYAARATRTYIGKYGRNEQSDVRKQAAKFTVPLLTTAGGKESDFFHLHARELAEAAGPELGTWHIVEGANHQ